MDHIVYSSTTSSLPQHIIQGSTVNVSDGSYYPRYNVGACAWIISTPDGLEYISGGGVIPGTDEEQSAYRSKLGGQLGLTIFLTSIQLPDTANPTLTIACDGKSALSKVVINTSDVHCKDKHVDFISIISELWNKSQLSVQKQHVYGHQDTTYRIITRLELINCQMDLRAKQIARLHILSNKSDKPSTPTTLGFGIILRGKEIISSNIKKSL